MSNQVINDSDWLPNTTQVPNVVMDWMMAELSPTQFKVLMFFIRQRYGFRLFNGSFEYSIHEIMNGLTTRITKPDGSHEIKRVCAGTGLSKDAVIQAIRGLSKNNAIAITRKGNRRITHQFELGKFNSFKPDDLSLVVKTNQSLDGKNGQKDNSLDGKNLPLRNQLETNHGNKDESSFKNDSSLNASSEIKKEKEPEAIFLEAYWEAFKSAMGRPPAISWAGTIKITKNTLGSRHVALNDVLVALKRFMGDHNQRKDAFKLAFFWSSLDKYLEPDESDRLRAADREIYK